MTESGEGELKHFFLVTLYNVQKSGGAEATPPPPLSFDAVLLILSMDRDVKPLV